MKTFGYFLLVWLTATAPLPAALEFTLAPSVQSGPVGTEVTFSGTLKNNSPTENLFINDIQFNLGSAAVAALAPNSNVFFASVPGILLPNETYSGPIFAVTIKSAPTQADYSGSVTIRGGGDIFASTNLLTNNFQVSSDVLAVTVNGGHLQVQFRRNTAATDLAYVIEGCFDLTANSWSPVLTRNAGGEWIINQPGATVSESGAGNLVLVTAVDSVPLIDPNTSQPTPHRFLRLRILDSGTVSTSPAGVSGKIVPSSARRPAVSPK
jgi:hypothetical protein